MRPVENPIPLDQNGETSYAFLYMKPELLTQIKADLEKERARLERELVDFSHKNKANAGRFVPEYPESGGSSDDDNAMEVSTYADELSLGEKLEAELRDTTRAIQAIDKGTYGVCKYCGKDIDEKRLQARPTSSSCIECKKTLTQEL